MEKAMHRPSNTANQTGLNSSELGAEKPALKINTAREAAFMAELLTGSPSTRELSTKTGATNAPDVILKLRKRGWKIETVREWVKTRYKERVKAGRYELDPSQLEDAKQAISAFTQRVKPKGFE